MRGKLYFTVGLPRSGKSTFCDQWARSTDIIDWTRDPGEGEPYVSTIRPRAIVAGDAFRHALYGGEFNPRSEGTVFAMMDVATRALLERGFDVIIDETCTTEATLLRYLRIDKDATPIFIEATVNECIDRANATNKPYLLLPIKRMGKQLERLRRNWDAIYERLREQIVERSSADVIV